MAANNCSLHVPKQSQKTIDSRHGRRDDSGHFTFRTWRYKQYFLRKEGVTTTLAETMKSFSLGVTKQTVTDVCVSPSPGMRNTSGESELASVHSSASVTCLFLQGSGPNYNRARHRTELEPESISRGQFQILSFR